MKALLIDLDGVLYVGNQPVVGAADAVKWVVAQGIPHLFLTNITSRSRSEIVDHLSAMGITIDPSHLLTPPLVAARWLEEHSPGPAALFVPQPVKDEFKGLDRLPEESEKGASSVVVGDLGEKWNYRVLNRAFRILMQEPRPILVTLGRTRYWRAEDGLRLDVAPFVTALEYAVGTEAKVVGKPATIFFRAALEAIGATEQETVMVGDDIRGDVGGAQGAGIAGLLVKTGKFRPADLEEGIRPLAVLDSIAQLPQWWEATTQG